MLFYIISVTFFAATTSTDEITTYPSMSSHG